MDVTESKSGIVTEFNTFEMLQLSKMVKPCNQSIINLIKTHKIEKFLALNLRADTFAEDAMTFGALSSRSGSTDINTDTVASVCHTLLFALVRMITMETPPWEAFGDTHLKLKRMVLKAMEAQGRFPFFTNDVLIDVARQFGPDCINPDVTYHAFEILKSNEGKPLAYRFMIFIPAMSQTHPAGRLESLFKSNALRRRELKTGRPALQDKGLRKLLVGKNDQDSEFLTEISDAVITGRYDMVRPILVSGPPNELAYESSYLSVESCRVWCDLVSCYLENGMKSSSVNTARRAAVGFVPNGNIFDYETIATNPEAVVVRHDAELTNDTHPFNPANIFSKEVSMKIFTEGVREEQTNLANYFEFDGIITGNTTKDLFSLNVRDCAFKGFPFPEDVYFYQRDQIIPSVLFNMLLPTTLEDRNCLGYFRELEKKKDSLFVSDEDFTRKVNLFKNGNLEAPEYKLDTLDGMSPEDFLAKVMYESIVYKSMNPAHMRSLFERYTKGYKAFTLELINAIGVSVRYFINISLQTFVRTGKGIPKILLEHKSIQELSLIDLRKNSGRIDLDHLSDDEKIKLSDIFIDLHQKNTEVAAYIKKKYGTSPFFADVMESIKDINTLEFWRAFMFSERVSEPVRKSRHNVMTRPCKDQWPGFSCGFTSNLSVYGDYVIQDQSFYTDSLAIVDKQKILQVLHLASYAAFIYAYDQTHQTAAVGLSGISSVGKSAVLMVIAKICTEGAIETVSYSSAKAFTVEGNRNDVVKLYHEMNEADFGGKNLSPADVERSRQFKEGMETGRIVSEVATLVTDDYGRTKRDRVRYVNSCQCAYIGAFNFSLDGKDSATLNRFLMVWVPMNNAVHGYRIKDARVHQGYGNLLSSDVVDAQVQEYKLLHFYGLVMAKMLQANVFCRDICMEGVDQVLKDFDQINQRASGVKTDTRFLGQVRKLLEAAVIKYSTRVVTTSPMARMYCMDEQGRYKKFHPRIFTEMGTRFLFCTKEMIIHVLTLLDDTWKQTMNKKIMFEIAEYFLGEIDERGESAIDYMVDQSQSDGPEIKDKRYVWLVEDTEEEVNISLSKKIKGLQMRPQDLVTVIKDQVGEMIDVEADDEDYVPTPAPSKSKSKAKKKDEMEIEDEFVIVDSKDKKKASTKKQLVPSIINAVKSSNKEQLGSLLSAYGQDSMDSDSSDNTLFSTNKPTNVGVKRKREETQADEENVKPSSSKKRMVSLPMVRRGNAVRGSARGTGRYIAFCLKGLEKIRREFKSHGNVISKALDVVFGDKSFQLYDPRLEEAMRDLDISEEKLLNAPFITGHQGKTAVYTVTSITESSEKSETITVPLWRCPPLKTFKRSDKATFYVKNRIIGNANAGLVFAGKRYFNNLSHEVKPSVLTAVVEDFDSTAYKINCMLNNDDILDSRAIISLPPITKKYIVALIQRDFPKIHERFTKNPHKYPESFVADEFYRALLLHVYDPKRNESDPGVAKQRMELFKGLLSSHIKLNDVKTYSIDPFSGEFLPADSKHKDDVIDKVVELTNMDKTSDTDIASANNLKVTLGVLHEMVNESGVGTTDGMVTNMNSKRLCEWMDMVPNNQNGEDNVVDNLNKTILDQTDPTRYTIERVPVDDIHKEMVSRMKEDLNSDLVHDLSKMDINSSNNNNTSVQASKSITRTVVKRESNILGLGPRDRKIGDLGISQYQCSGKNYKDNIRAALERDRSPLTQSAPPVVTNNNNNNNNNTNTPAAVLKEEPPRRRLLEMIKAKK